jgi:hypothetical protein
MELSTLKFGSIESIFETDESRAFYDAMESLTKFVADEDYRVVNLGPHAFGVSIKHRR